MIPWLIIILILLIVIFLFYQKNSQSKTTSLSRIDTSYGSSEIDRRFIETNSKPDWLAQAADELATFGYPKSEIDRNQIVIQSNLEQIQKDNLQSLEEKKKDPTSDPPKYGITIASIYTPEEFLSNNTGLKVYLPPPPQSGIQPTPSSYGTVIVADKTKILPNLNYSNLSSGIKLPVYNQNQCGCCWVVACAIPLDYHLYKASNNSATGDSSSSLKRITFPNLYTFCVNPNTPRGFSRQSSGCRGGIPTDVFVDINDSKILRTVINQPQNLSFDQNNNNCTTMLQEKNNPILNVESTPFKSNGVIALYNDGKFYYNKQVNNPNTFLPTSRLMTFTDEQVDVIKYLLSTNGPMVVGINATGGNITNYKSGVLNLPGGKPDHAVALIGYQDNYWIIQNSWSEKWGMNGIMYADIKSSHLTMITTLTTEYTDLGKMFMNQN
jgi:C1A family cysteine protease